MDLEQTEFSAERSQRTRVKPSRLTYDTLDSTTSI